MQTHFKYVSTKKCKHTLYQRKQNAQYLPTQGIMYRYTQYYINEKYMVNINFDGKHCIQCREWNYDKILLSSTEKETDKIE